MHFHAPAKINLHLRVGSLATDGFHPLLTWMTTIGLFDDISIAKNPVISMTCSETSLPCDDRNLVIKAAKMLQQNPQDGANIYLKKNIPHGGGLGGGSADAAFTLIALNQFWNLKIGQEKLNSLAATLGSDIPFFMHGPSSICTGRGEVVRPVSLPVLAKWVLLILPEISILTPAVYRTFDQFQMGDPGNISTQPDWNQWASLCSEDLLPHLVNDLEPAAFKLQPALSTLRGDLQQLLSRPVRMSGSGSSLFTLYDAHKDAQAAANLISGKGPFRAMPVKLAPIDSQSAH